MQQQFGGGSWTSLRGENQSREEGDLRAPRAAGLLQRGAGGGGGAARSALVPAVPAGNVTSAAPGAGRLRLEEAARLGCAVHTSPRGGRAHGQAAGMSAKERPKGKVIKDSVTLLPCFYFVEVSWPSAVA